MNNFIYLHTYGHELVPDFWISKVPGKINRLYYIHSGSGGFIHNGKYTEFKKGWIYYFPFPTDVDFVWNNDNKILHTYANFELIPPLISREVLEFNPERDAKAMAALSVFIEGSKQASENIRDTFNANKEFFSLYKNSISYLIMTVARANRLNPLDDEIIINSLKFIHDNLSSEISVNSMAASAYMSTDAFIRRFKRVVNTTPYAYIRMLRLQTALTLRENGFSLDKIAEKTGYANTSSLLHALNKNHL